MPALLLYSACDQIIPLSEAQAMHVGLRGSQLVVVPEAWHLLGFENSRAFNESVRGYLVGLG
ncbi:MAG: hypothetical protein A2W35_09530 [Chloroflexi bacterium RBG_16_57_11]|nr:MAG: hypothetical protein A2W35_09530 [Chloroflexi bacterium RBG_16_57_11]